MLKEHIEPCGHMAVTMRGFLLSPGAYSYRGDSHMDAGIEDRKTGFGPQPSSWRIRLGGEAACRP